MGGLIKTRSILLHRYLDGQVYDYPRHPIHPGVRRSVTEIYPWIAHMRFLALVKKQELEFQSQCT